MAKSRDISGSDHDPMSDVLRIRDILFGEKIEDYEQRFSMHGDRLDDLQSQLKALEQRFEARQQKEREETQAQFQELQAMLMAQIESLAHAKTSRAALAAMLVEMGERLRSDAA